MNDSAPMVALRLAAFLTALLATSGCRSATEIVLVVDSDLEPATELSRVEIAVAGGIGDAEVRSFDVAETGLPFSLAVASVDGSAYEVRIATSGLDAEGQPFVSRDAQVSFVEGRAVRLDIPLARTCAYQDELCNNADETCGDGACIPTAIDGEALPDAPSGPPPRLFDGPSAPLDSGAPPDAGLDAGCVEGAACSPPRTCMTGTVRCVDGTPTCEATSMMPAGASCGNGRFCDDEGQCR